MRRIGLVLGAGGVAGQAYHAGVLAALAEGVGWDARSAVVVVGTSAGSITGALLRSGVAPHDLTTGRYRRAQQRTSPEDAAALGDTADPGDRSRGTATTTLAAAGARARRRLGGRIAGALPPGRISPGGIVTMVRQVAGERWPAEPLWVCAVRRGDGRRVVFGHEGAPRPPLPLAVAASCAIPGYFEPVRVDGVEYVDGGAHSPTNLDLLGGLGLDAVVVSSPMSTAEATAARLDLPARLLFRATLARETFAVRRRGTPVVSLQPSAEDLEVMSLNAMDPSQWSAVVDRTRQTTLRRLTDGPLRRAVTG